MKNIKYLLVVFSILLLTACGSKNNVLKDTTWTANDNSEIVFKNNRVTWYKTSKNDDKNYYSGKYKVYLGKKATKYLTNDLKEYGVTESELKTLYSTSSKDYYKEDNLIVIDINYEEYILDGKKQKIENSNVPMFGFINNDKSYLDVANMVTGSYYGFTKVK